ncbi:7688_t:CDS:1, partial [Funneliformis geosporum]
QELPALETSNVNAKNSKKRYYCIGLRSAEISKCIQRTPAQFDNSHLVEIVT